MVSQFGEISIFIVEYGILRRLILFVVVYISRDYRTYIRSKLVCVFSDELTGMKCYTQFTEGQGIISRLSKRR